jgi:hypothetical protein
MRNWQDYLVLAVMLASGICCDLFLPEAPTETPREWCYTVLGTSLCTIDSGTHFYRVPPPVEIGGRNAD